MTFKQALLVLLTVWGLLIWASIALHDYREGHCNALGGEYHYWLAVCKPGAD